MSKLLTSLSVRPAQMFCSAVRFGELRVANNVFRTGHEALLLKRRIFGSTLILNTSRSASQQLLYLTGERAVPERLLLRRLLRPGMRVVDVGANIGYYAAMCLKWVGQEGHVTCIEPSPENLKELNVNVRENNWKNVDVYECAVGDQAATVGLRDGVNSGVVTLGEGVTQVPVYPLDYLISDRCDFLKIDVEGYEWQVLQGAQRLIERDRPILFLEYHPELVGRHGGSSSEVLSFLRNFYSRLQFFDVPNVQSISSKFMTRYFGADAVRQIDISGIPEERLHVGRLQGTLWSVAT